MRPVVAPAGTLAMICLAVLDTMVALVPLNATLVAPERFWPVMVTATPAAPERGVKLLISGVTVVVIRPIELLPVSVNHIAPSGPAVIPLGPLIRRPVYSVTFPAVAI